MVKRKGISVQNADLAAFTEFSVHFFFADLCMLSSPVRRDGFSVRMANKRVWQNLREGTAPPCRGAGPTGLRGFTPTDTHIKYVFVDVRPLRRFAPPPLQGRALKKSPLTKMCYRNVNKKTHICCKRNVLYAI